MEFHALRCDVTDLATSTRLTAPGLESVGEEELVQRRGVSEDGVRAADHAPHLRLLGACTHSLASRQHEK